MKQPQSSITIHCWWPNWNILAAGLVLGATGLGTAVGLLGSLFPWRVAIGLTIAVFVLVYWWAYCSITVTPWTVEIRGSGFLKLHYSSPMEEVMLSGRWALGEPYSGAKQANAGLYIGTEEDWDTGIAYLELQFYGEDIWNSFRESHYPPIRAAFTSMLTQRERIEATKPAD